MFSPDSFFYAQMQFISGFASVNYILIPSVTLPILYLYLRRYKNEAFILFLGSGIAFPLSQALKGIFRTPRPSLENLTHYLPTDIYGFPSGHVIFYTVFWGFLFYLTFKLTKIDSIIRKSLRLLALYFLIFVGVSRIVLDVHYLIDVIGGYIIGGGLLLTMIMVDKKLQNTSNPRAKD
jgi:membrane-associated phospholipid phosphatase